MHLILSCCSSHFGFSFKKNCLVPSVLFSLQMLHGAKKSRAFQNTRRPCLPHWSYVLLASSLCSVAVHGEKDRWYLGKEFRFQKSGRYWGGGNSNRWRSFCCESCCSSRWWWFLKAQMQVRATAPFHKSALRSWSLPRPLGKWKVQGVGCNSSLLDLLSNIWILSPSLQCSAKVEGIGFFLRSSFSLSLSLCFKNSFSVGMKEQPFEKTGKGRRVCSVFFGVSGVQRSQQCPAFLWGVKQSPLKQKQWKGFCLPIVWNPHFWRCREWGGKGLETAALTPTDGGLWEARLGHIWQGGELEGTGELHFSHPRWQSGCVLFHAVARLAFIPDLKDFPAWLLLMKLWLSCPEGVPDWFLWVSFLGVGLIWVVCKGGEAWHKMGVSQQVRLILLGRRGRRTSGEGERRPFWGKEERILGSLVITLASCLTAATRRESKNGALFFYNEQPL